MDETNDEKPTERVSLTLTPRIYSALKDESKATGRSMSWHVRRALESQLEALEEPDAPV